MNNGDREYFDTLCRSIQAEMRAGAQALNQVDNKLGKLEATVKSLPVRCEERQHGCDARFENTEGYMESLERNQAILTKANITGFLILLGAIVGKTFI